MKLVFQLATWAVENDLLTPAETEYLRAEGWLSPPKLREYELVPQPDGKLAIFQDLPGPTMPTMTPSPKPCPFCGCAFLHIKATNRDRGGEHVGCLKCRALGPFGGDEADAVELWNAAPRRETKHGT